MTTSRVEMTISEPARWPSRRQTVRVLLEQYGLAPLEWWETTKAGERRFLRWTRPGSRLLSLANAAAMGPELFAINPHRPARATWEMVAPEIRKWRLRESASRAGWRHAVPIATACAVAFAVLVVWSVR